MKKENPDDPKNPEKASAPEAPAKARKQKKEKKARERKKPQADDVRLPVLVELTYTISVLFFIFVGFTVIITSLLTGASLLILVLRTSAAMLVVGSLLVVIFHLISSGALQASLVEQEEAQKPLTEELQAPVNPEHHQTVEA